MVESLNRWETGRWITERQDASGSLLEETRDAPNQQAQQPFDARILNRIACHICAATMESRDVVIGIRELLRGLR